VFIIAANRGCNVGVASICATIVLVIGLWSRKKM